MKAIVVHQYGGPEVLKFEEYPDPVAGPGEVLVRVAATSVNPIDYKRRAGKTQDFYPIKFPGLIGVDVAGTVLTLGPGVEGFRSRRAGVCGGGQRIRRALRREGDDPCQGTGGTRLDRSGGFAPRHNDRQPIDLRRCCDQDRPDDARRGSRRRRRTFSSVHREAVVERL